MVPTLPHEILALIFIHLALPDIACAAAVCVSWRKTITSFINAYGLSPRHVAFLIPSRRRNLKAQISTLMSPYGKRTPGHARRRCIGAHGDWLAIADEFEGPYLLHALLRYRINLPAQSTLPINTPASQFAMKWHYSPYFIHKIILSSPPNNNNCFIVAIFGTEEIAYCRPGSRFWMELEPGDWRESRYNDAVFFKGELFAVDDRAYVWAFYLGVQSWVAKRVVVRPGLGWGDNGLNSRYLMESNGQLLMVVREREVMRSRPYQITKFRRLKTVNLLVMQLDPGSMKWTSVVSLENQVMFLGRSLATLVPGDEVTLRLGVNCVYFTEDNTTDSREPEDMGMFRMSDQKVVSCHRRRGDPIFFYLFNYNSLL